LSSLESEKSPGDPLVPLKKNQQRAEYYLRPAIGKNYPTAVSSREFNHAPFSAPGGSPDHPCEAIRNEAVISIHLFRWNKLKIPMPSRISSRGLGNLLLSDSAMKAAFALGKTGIKVALIVAANGVNFIVTGTRSEFPGAWRVDKGAASERAALRVLKSRKRSRKRFSAVWHPGS
jgi:hypothetical protein